jgi:hypothetical protein
VSNPISAFAIILFYFIVISGFAIFFLFIIISAFAIILFYFIIISAFAIILFYFIIISGFAIFFLSGLRHSTWEDPFPPDVDDPRKAYGPARDPRYGTNFQKYPMY